MRAPILLLGLAAYTGCTLTNACKSGTVLLTITFDSTSAAADGLDIALSLEGGPADSHPLAHHPGSLSGTVEIDFSGAYPKGESLAIQVTALLQGVPVGVGNATLRLTGGCGNDSVKVLSGADLGLVDDLVSPPSEDLSRTDLGVPVDIGTLDIAGPLRDLGGNTMDLTTLPIPCNSALDCVGASQPICDAATHNCRPCSNSSDDGQCSTHNANYVCRPLGSTSLAGQCVECNTNTQCLGLPGPSPQPRPVCTTATGNCRACALHTECSSQVCNISAALTGNAAGTCTDPNDVMYLDNQNGTCNPGVGTHDGNTATPFCDVSSAGVVITGPSNVINRHYIHYATSTAPYLPFGIAPTAPNVNSGSFDITIVGSGRVAAPFPTPSPYPTTSTISGGNPGPAGFYGISVSNTGTPLNVVIDSMDIVGAATSHGADADRDAINCNGVNAATSLSVFRSSLHDSGGSGVDSLQCSITVRISTISGNSKYGLLIDGNSVGSPFSLDETFVANNTWGVWMQGGPTYTITNNIVYGNAGATSSLGVRFSQTGSGQFQFNTVAKNGSTGAGGVDCLSSSLRILESSIIWGNSTSGGSQIGGTKCWLLQVVTGTDSYGGAIQTNPTFVNGASAPFDFHLASASPNSCCVDQVFGPLDGGIGPLTDHDVDGTPRPRSAGWDIGAHELK